MCNIDVRRAAAGNGVRLWQVADALGIADAQLSRKLRKELPDDEKEKSLKSFRRFLLKCETSAALYI